MNELSTLYWFARSCLVDYNITIFDRSALSTFWSVIPRVILQCQSAVSLSDGLRLRTLYMTSGAPIWMTSICSLIGCLVSAVFFPPTVAMLYFGAIQYKVGALRRPFHCSFFLSLLSWLCGDLSYGSLVHPSIYNIFFLSLLLLVMLFLLIHF